LIYYVIKCAFNYRKLIIFGELKSIIRFETFECIHAAALFIHVMIVLKLVFK